MKKNELAKKNFRPGDLVAYIEDEKNWNSTRIRYAQILSSEFYGIEGRRFGFRASDTDTELFGKPVSGVDHHAKIKDALAIADDDGNRTISDRGSLIRAREIEFIVSIDEIGELEKIVADREAARQARLEESRAKRDRENAENAAAREELNKVLGGTRLYAPFGREAVRVLAIAKAYHEAKSEQADDR